MRRLLCVWLTIFLLCICVTAQTGGTVLGRKGRPLQGVRIFYTHAPDHFTLSDTQGKWHLDKIETKTVRSSKDAPILPRFYRGTLMFNSSHRFEVTVHLYDIAGQKIFSASHRLPAGDHALDLRQHLSSGTFIVQYIQKDRPPLLFRHIVAGGPVDSSPAHHPLSTNPAGRRKVSGPNRITTEHPDYFSRTITPTGDDPLTIQLCRKEQNILVFGNSYSRGWYQYARQIAASIGATINVVCLRGGGAADLDGWANRQDSYNTSWAKAKSLSLGEAKKLGYAALEEDYDTRLRTIDCLELTNLDSYAAHYNSSKALERAVETMKKVDEWDIFTDKTGSKWANNPLFGNENFSIFADTLQAHWPGGSYLFEELIAGRNDYFLLREYNQTFDDRYLEAADDPATYTETKHYKDIRYATLFKQATIDRIDGIIPWATTIQNLRFDPEYGYTPFPDPVWNYKSPNGTFPAQEKSFHRGVVRVEGNNWRADHHPNNRGNYVLAATAVATIFRQDLRESTYRPGDLLAEDIRIINRVASETVLEGLQPDTTSRLEP